MYKIRNREFTISDYDPYIENIKGVRLVFEKIEQEVWGGLGGLSAEDQNKLISHITNLHGVGCDTPPVYPILYSISMQPLEIALWGIISERCGFWEKTAVELLKILDDNRRPVLEIRSFLPIFESLQDIEPPRAISLGNCFFVAPAATRDFVRHRNQQNDYPEILREVAWFFRADPGFYWQLIANLPDFQWQHIQGLGTILSGVERSAYLPRNPTDSGQLIRKHLENSEYFLKRKRTSSEVLGEIRRYLIKYFRKQETNPLGIIIEKSRHLWPEKWYEVLRALPRKSRQSPLVFSILLKLATSERFSGFIQGRIWPRTLSQEERALAKNITAYNRRLKTAFRQRALRWEIWHGFSKERAIVLAKRTADETLLKEFDNTVHLVLGRWREKKPGVLPSEKVKKIWKRVIKAHDLMFDEDSAVRKNNGGLLTQKELVGCVREFIEIPEVKNLFVEHAAEKTDVCVAIRRLTELLTERGHQRFLVKLWQRNPFRDLFQGDFLDNCIALSRSSGENIAKYLLDAGVHILEVTDENNAVMAQTFLWLAEEKNGKLHVVLDNIEIRKTLRDTAFAEEILKGMLRWTRDFVSAVGLSGADILVGERQNDINLAKYFPIIQKEVRKLSGAPYEEMLDALGGTCDPSQWKERKFYFTGSTEIFPNEIGKVTAEVCAPSGLTPDARLLENILTLEQLCFPDKETWDKEEFIRALTNSGAILIVAKDKKGAVVGYIIAEPQNKQLCDSLDENQRLDPNPEVLYVSSAAVHPTWRSSMAFLLMAGVLRRKTREAGFKKLSWHTENPRLARFGVESKEIEEIEGVIVNPHHDVVWDPYCFSAFY